MAKRKLVLEQVLVAVPAGASATPTASVLTDKWLRDWVAEDWALSQTEKRIIVNELTRERAARLAAEQRAARYEAALRDAIACITGGSVASIGSIDNTYCPQISKATVERLRDALRGSDAAAGTTGAKA